MRKLFFIPITSLTLLLVACHTSYKTETLTYNNVRITSAQSKDASMLEVIKPYSDSINKSMNDIVGLLDNTLEKKHPSGTLGYFMVDAVYTLAQEKFNTRIDVAFVNYGGIRLTQLPAGPITRAKIFELMPFDNLIVLQKLTGVQLQQFLDHIAIRGGWPVAGITMEIKDKKAVNVLVAGKPLDPTAVYTTANSDFVANGGDESAMLRTIPQQNIGYLMRTAIFEYIDKFKAQGKNVSVNEDNRIKNVD